MTIYYGVKVEATVRKGSLTVESKVVDIIDSSELFEIEEAGPEPDEQ